MFSTYLGGSDSDAAYGVDVGAVDNVYVTGYTRSANFPRTVTNISLHGIQDAFVTRVGAPGGLVYSRFLGGSGSEIGRGIAARGYDAYVTGEIASTDFPVVNALQASFGGGATDAFVTKVSVIQTEPLPTGSTGGVGNPHKTGRDSRNICNRGDVLSVGSTISPGPSFREAVVVPAG